MGATSVFMIHNHLGKFGNLQVEEVKPRMSIVSWTCDALFWKLSSSLDRATDVHNTGCDAMRVGCD